MMVRFISFNPTLVRLRPSSSSPAAITYRRFQSHAGSIEARPGPHQPERQIPFQSHAGSIEAPSAPDRVRVVEGVSIPRWFD